MKEVLLLFVNPILPEPTGYDGSFLVLEIFQRMVYNKTMNTLGKAIRSIIFVAMVYAAFVVSPWMGLGFCLVLALALFKK